jgi:hypothetical protein
MPFCLLIKINNEEMFETGILLRIFLLRFIMKSSLEQNISGKGVDFYVTD